MADHKTATKAIDAVKRKPRLYLPLGRQRTGKTVLSRVLIEALDHPYRLRVIDADPNNQSLSQARPDSEVPPYVDGDERREWIEQCIDRLVSGATGDEDRHDVIMDLGGNDLLLKRLGAEVALADMLESFGVQPVAIHMLGTDDADLSYLRDVEDNGLFCPKATILVLNRGLVSPSRDHVAAFKPVMDSDIVRRTVARGARVVVMPALDKVLMERTEKLKLTSFRAALLPENIKTVGLLNATRVKLWLERDLPVMVSQIEEYLNG